MMSASAPAERGDWLLTPPPFIGCWEKAGDSAAQSQVKHTSLCRSVLVFVIQKIHTMYLALKEKTSRTTIHVSLCCAFQNLNLDLEGAFGANTPVPNPTLQMRNLQSSEAKWYLNLQIPRWENYPSRVSLCRGPLFTSPWHLKSAEQ